MPYAPAQQRRQPPLALWAPHFKTEINAQHRCTRDLGGGIPVDQGPGRPLNNSYRDNYVTKSEEQELTSCGMVDIQPTGALLRNGRAVWCVCVRALVLDQQEATIRVDDRDGGVTNAAAAPRC